MMDYDPLLSDDIIGETSIDLERRYFDEKWINLPEYPIETRELRKAGSCNSTGSIRLWVEIFNPAERYNNFSAFKLTNSIAIDQRSSKRDQRDAVNSSQIQAGNSKSIKNSILIQNPGGERQNEALETNPTNFELKENPMQKSKTP